MGWSRAWWLSMVVGCVRVPPDPVAPDPEAQPEAPVQAATLDDEGRRALEDRATQAYLAGDYDAHTEAMRQLLAADPDDDRSRYNLACGHALAGRGDEALEQLQILLDRRIDLGAAADPDFRSLAGDPRFEALIEAFGALYPAVSTSSVLFEIDDFDLRPEGMAYDAASGRYFLSSMRHSKVIAVDAAGSVTDFVHLDVDGIGVSVLGLRVDPQRGWLWAVGNANPQVEGYHKDHAGVSAVFAVDLASGQRQRTIRPEDEARGFNDLVVAPDGDVYLSGGGLWRVAGGQGPPERADLELDGSNGIAWGPDDDTLYLSTRDAVLKVDVRTWSTTPLTGPEGEEIAFFDGMYAIDGGLTGIQIGSRWRAVQLGLDDDGDEVVSVRVLEQSNPGLTGATTGAVVGTQLHYLAFRRPDDAELESIDAAERGLASKPVVMAAPLQ